jgi:hypothetical protein
MRQEAILEHYDDMMQQVGPTVFARVQLTARWLRNGHPMTVLHRVAAGITVEIETIARDCLRIF